LGFQFEGQWHTALDLMVQLAWLVVEADTISTLTGSREPNVTCGEFEGFLVMDGILTAGYLGDTW